MNNPNKKNVILMEDDLDRGEYAMTLFKIIADYSPKVPKKGYEVHYETIDLGEIVTGEITITNFWDKDTIGKLPARDAIHPTSKETPSNKEDASPEPNYEGRLHHLDNAAFIMAISGSWGTGKTTFINLLRDLLIDSKKIKDKGDEAESIRQNHFLEDEVVIFDAWKHDFYDDPMIPFSRMLIEKVCGKGTEEYTKASDQFSEYLKSLHKSTYEVAVDTIAGMLSESSTRTLLPKDIRSLVDKVKTDLKNKDQVLSDDALSLEERIFSLQSILQKCIRKKTQKKVVIIVDELDRCKPTFAIQLLETVKHLFNIKGLVFIFSLDIGELQHCVKTVYGHDFDAIGYLERFFDYNSMLPKGNEKKLFDKFAKEYELPNDASQYYNLCLQFNLTPREMKGLCSSFYYLNKYQLEGYPEKARLLYFYILLLKYRHPDKMQNLNAIDSKDRIAIFSQHKPDFLNVTGANPQPFYTAVTENMTFSTANLYYVKPDNSCGEKADLTNEKSIQIEAQGSISNILFAKDLEGGISNLLDLHILEFLFNKVESYSGAIPLNKKEDTIRRGSILYFGQWYINDEKKKEPIEWIVLNVQDEKALLISRYAIDSKPYNEEDKATTWAECTLKHWLNGEFIHEAFNEEERNMIDVTHVVAEKNPNHPEVNPGIDVDDKIFLLSIEEAARLFETDKARVCYPTIHAKNNGIYIYDGSKSTWWWLRSPGDYGSLAAVVYRGGDFIADGIEVGYGDVGVRPALWLILNP